MVVSPIRRGCRSCLSVASRYRGFLGAPATLVTVVSAALLLAAVAVDPSGLVSGEEGAARLLYLASALVGSSFIWWSALQGIRERDFTADIPVSVATAAAIAIGQFAAAAIVAVLLLVGGLLEEFVAARAGAALGALERLLPEEVTVRRDGCDERVPVATVERGEVVVVRPGERVGVDGEVAFGQGSVNEAAVTGESVPLEKEAGDAVFAGTLLTAGALEVCARATGEETTVGRIRCLVEAASGERAPIERLLDRYAKLYTPIALALALALWLSTGDPLQAITMLIVFCPCVMVIATPTALVASIGNAALRGSLVKQGATIEALARIDTVIFDKTGTLTTGEPRLGRIVSLDGSSDRELLRLAATAERLSEHPFGRALVTAAAERGVAHDEIDEFEQLAGLGVRVRLADDSVLVGGMGLLNRYGVDVGAEHGRRAAELAGSGHGVVLLARNEVAAGLYAFDDPLRAEAAETVDRLHRLGLRTAMVSGDRAETAARIAGAAGIDEVHADVLPERKLTLVREQQEGGRRVAFVGDGVNDGPALAAADVGIAMGLTGTDLALETADVALLADDLGRLPHLVSLAQDALRAIRQNLVFSLAVLAVSVGLTIAGILHPVSGALLHELSSIPVIANSARLINRRGRV